MADVNQFKRSKDKLLELLDQLMGKTIKDESTILFIDRIKQSINILDQKREELVYMQKYTKS